MTTRLHFTRARLDDEQPPAKGRRVVWDDEVAGLCCRITSEGHKSLWLSKWADGAQRWLLIGAHPEVAVRDARARALEHLAAIVRGERPWETKKALAAEATLADLWDHHATHAKGRKRPATLALYTHAWAHLAPLHKQRASHITRGDVQREVDRIGRTHPVMANRCHSLLGVLYATAIEGEIYTGHNPAIGVKRFEERTRDRFLSADELRAWWLAVEHEPECWRIYFAAAVLCGARKGNVSGMRWSDLDLSRGVWRIPGEKSKNGEPLLVILPAPLVALLTDWRDRCPSKVWTFPSPDPEAAAGHVTDPKKPWRRVLNRATAFRCVRALADAANWNAEAEAKARADVLVDAERARVRALGRREAIDGDPLSYAATALRERVRKAGLDDAACDMSRVRVHDLRRTLGSWAAITGASLPIVGRALGHRSLRTTEIYARLSIDPVRDAVETAAGAILGHGGEAAARVLHVEAKP